VFFFFSSRRRHTRFSRDWSSDVCSSDLFVVLVMIGLTLSAFLTKHSEKAQFRVAAYNIRYAAQIDEESGNGWVIRKGPLASLIQIGRASCRERGENEEEAGGVVRR